MINRTEEEIKKNWAKDAPILLSICCITYNQKEYIEQCIDSFLLQDTNFPFEIIIHDDASIDGTIKVLQEYERSYPNIISVLYEEENQYSKGVRGIFVKFVFPHAKGKYIALCEGDDYWIDENKIQRQVDYLNKNNRCSLLAENTIVKNSIKQSEYLFSETESKEYTLNEILMKRKFATSSVLFRKKSIDKFLPDLKISNDTIIFACCATTGVVVYQPNISSVYRRGMQGVTENTDKYQWAKQNEEWTKQIYSLFYPDVLKKKNLNYNLFKSFTVAFLDAIKKKHYKIIWIILLKLFQYFRIHYIFLFIKEHLC